MLSFIISVIAISVRNDIWCFLSTISNCITSERAHERQALMTFFNKTGGDKWGKKDSWCTDAPLGEWFGVTTNDEGIVVRLSLEGNNLIGKAAFIFFSCNICAYYENLFSRASES